ncbi:MAG: flagellar basal body P-ring formation chaperone FlgA [Planctomycetota bacterium]|nr:flagellar basal body P-ring formation chaperone FlgA [Planctomycetota bacterium]
MIATLTATLLAGITIVLPMEAPVRGSEIELGELVTINGATPEQLALLEDIELGRAPTPGYSRTFDAQTIHMHVRRALPGVAVRYDGRRACRAYLETSTVSAKAMIEAVDLALGAEVGTRDVTWSPDSTLGALEVPLGSDASAEPELEVILGGTTVVSGLLPVELRIKVDGVTYRTVRANWKVSVWERLPVLTRNLPVGSKVSASFFELRRTELPADGRSAILSPASMVGAVAMRTLVEGSLVYSKDVERPMVLNEGDLCILIVAKGAIRAKVQVVALGTAGIGDIVRVRTMDTNKELAARVLSDELVEVNLDA